MRSITIVGHDFGSNPRFKALRNVIQPMAQQTLNYGLHEKGKSNER
jgi:hypothetical protein